VEAAAYRARKPAETALYALLESLYESVKGPGKTSSSDDLSAVTVETGRERIRRCDV